jgi:monovalent cation:H+ antiporter-2, CPA2 family
VVVPVALGLAQIGELSFVLLEVGREQGLIAAPLYQQLIGVAVLTMAAAPAQVAAAGWFSRWWERRRGGDGGEPPGDEAEPRGHVVIVGLGPVGQTLARVLRASGVPYTAIDLNGETVQRARAAGEPVVYGDASRREVLLAAGADRAQVVVFVLSGIDALRASLPLARSVSPAAELIVRAPREAQVDELREAGADTVVAEEFETSIEILTRVLRFYHVPRNVILAETKLLRGGEYRMMREPSTGFATPATLLRVLAAGTTDLFQVVEGSPLAGSTLAEVDLRRRTGATVLAVVREGEAITNPGPELRFAAGDVLVLVGSHADVEQAFTVLERPAREAGSEPGENGR